VLTVTELAARAGTPVSTIKFYVREKVLSPGNLDAPHRAFYDDSHVRRLWLIAVLRDVAELPLARVKSLCRVLDRDAARDDVSKVIAHVIDAIARRGPVRAATSAEIRAARRQVLDMLATRNIQVRGTARSVTELAGALVGLRKTLGPTVTAELRPVP
jgi:DNA-binding transcriptional MerR regulator